MTPERAVAKFLLDVADRRGALLDMSMTRRDMADHLGLTVEMACRILSRFVETRIIAIPDIYQIEIVDRTALEAVVGTDC
jgi:CRP-like cAMP-binding protein